jgi:hypothetical protein
MKKLKDTLTNEGRQDIVDPNYARFRANKLKVVLIFDSENPRINVNSIQNKFNNTLTVYERGKIVYPDQFDEAIDEVYTHGIHYFKTIDAAFYYERKYCQYYSGLVLSHYSNGQKISEGNYVNCLEHGIWTFWHSCGKTKAKGTFIEGKKVGKWTYYHVNGKLGAEENF